MKHASKSLLCVLVVALAIGGCSRRQHDWETARTADTIESYQTFLKTFPDGEFASQAQARVRELEEDRDWQQAQTANTAESYQQFLNQYPEGRMSDEARIRIENFALSQVPAAQVPPQTATAEMPGETLPPQPSMPEETTTPKPVTASPSIPEKTAMNSTGGYRIQLGAFSGSDKKAMSEWRRLERQYPKLLSGLTPSIKLATTPSGHLYRLQAGKTTETRAREICTALKARKQDCVVVLP